MSDYDDADGAVGGFLAALLVVFILGVTFGLGRCTRTQDIASECRDYGKFESESAARSDQWYECAPLSSHKESPNGD